ncbi:MAG: hypothetical protein ACLSUW_05215 [Akkermansia sp.]
MNIPNLPHLECPVGADETANPEIKLWEKSPPLKTRRTMWNWPRIWA